MLNNISVSLTFLVLFILFYLIHFYIKGYTTFIEIIIGILVLLFFILSSFFNKEYRDKESLTEQEFQTFLTEANYPLYFFTALFFVFFLFAVLLKPLFIQMGQNNKSVMMFFGLSFVATVVFTLIFFFVLFVPLQEKLRT